MRSLTVTTLVILAFATGLLGSSPLSGQQPTANQQSPEDPVSIGIVLDNSKSMKDKRDSAVAALRDFVKTSNQQDEFFLVNFNGDVHLDQDFTTNPALIGKALDRADADGGTAMFDALVSSADHQRKSSRLKKHFLVLVTDGSDNMSHISSSNVLTDFKKPATPVVYCIGLFKAEDDVHGHAFLEKIAKETGGTAFFPKKPDDLKEIAIRIANEIRGR